MSDEQRGPYTPPRDEPLAFDARGARDARPMPMTLIASGVVLVVLIGGVIMAYAGGFHRKDEAQKVVGEPVASLKTPPPPGQAGSADPASRLAVFSNTAASSTPPAFAAAPEQPAERPKPQLQVQASHLPPVRIATTDDAPPARSAAAPKPAVAVTTHVVTPVAPARPIRLASASPSALPPAKPASAPAITASAATASTTGGVGVQIGAFSSKELADKGFADVTKLASTAGHGKRVEPVDHGGATLYRTTVTGFADRAAARSFCESLTAKGHACIVKG